MTPMRRHERPDQRPMWRRKRVLIPAALLAFHVVVAVVTPVDPSASPDPDSTGQPAATTAAPAPDTPPAEPGVPAEHEAALATATTYARDMHMSRAAVREQLVSEWGEQFPEDAADYAMQRVEADWQGNALVKARLYRDDMHMSTAAIRDQLVAEYGEQFTKAEADWAMANLEK